jgi:hypothetical protein
MKELNEQLQFLLDLGTDRTPHGRKNLYEHLTGTYGLLKDKQCREPVCAAGLFHSIYGTAHFHHKSFPIENRHVIRELIGYEAEFFAYVFCVTQRPEAFYEQIGRTPIIVHDMFLDRTARLSTTELQNLLDIEWANLTEQGLPYGPPVVSVDRLEAHP